MLPSPFPSFTQTMSTLSLTLKVLVYLFFMVALDLNNKEANFMHFLRLVANLDEAAATLDEEHVKCECVKAKVSKLAKMESSNPAATQFLDSQHISIYGCIQYQFPIVTQHRNKG